MKSKVIGASLSMSMAILIAGSPLPLWAQQMGSPLWAQQVASPALGSPEISGGLFPTSVSPHSNGYPATNGYGTPTNGYTAPNPSPAVPLRSQPPPGSPASPYSNPFQTAPVPQRPETLNAAPQPAAQPEVPSSIEVAFRDPAVRAPGAPAGSPGGLAQFGYSLFNAPVSTFAPVEDVPVGPDYVMGPGDDLRIQIWGAMENAIVQTVDRSGQIYLPTAGPVRLWGLTFSQADKLIREQLSGYYRGFQTSVTMGRLRSIKVYVVGEVRQPGSYTVSSLSSLTNGLFASGGPVKLGSLRRIELKRNHHTVGTFDLYDFLLQGDKTKDYRLESGDTIFVPPIGSVVAIAGEVKRPAIYEIQGTVRIMDLIDMAGGLTPQSYLKRVQVIRPKPNAEREVMDLDLTALHGNGSSPTNIELRNGDLVRIYAADPRVYNTVTLTGNVKYAGEYEYKPNMRLSQLLHQGSVLPEAYLEGVEIVRFKQDLTTDVIHANLKRAWAGDDSQDVALQQRDQITVRSEFQAHRTVTLGGEVKLPGTYVVRPGERLSSVIQRAGGFTDKAFLKAAVFTRKSVEETERKNLDEMMRRQEERFLIEARPGPLQTISMKEDQEGRQSRWEQAKNELKVIASKVTLGRVVIRMDDLEKFKGSNSDLMLEDGDKFVVPQKPATVVVVGSVRNPTAMLHEEGKDVLYYLNRAGGLSESAEKKEMFLLKADGSALAGFLRVRNVEPGDAILVPPKSQESDWGWLKDIAAIAGQGLLGVAALAAIF